MNIQDKEIEPNGMDFHAPGAKGDQGKIMAGLLADFSLALEEIAKVSTYGAKKYSPGGWQAVPDGIQRYTHAAWRHLLRMQRKRSIRNRGSGTRPRWCGIFWQGWN